MVEADRISVALNISSVFQAIALDILSVFLQDRAYYWSSLLIHFLVVEDFELPKSASYILSVP